MLISEWVRRESFWVIDYLKGSSVKRHYLDIESIMENALNPYIEKRKESYLADILKYATENVPFYKRIKSYDSIKSFPVINKNIIRSSYEEFQSPEFLEASVVKMHTSGSTGTPFMVRQDKNKRDRVFAEMIYFWGKAGYQIGMKYMFFRVWTQINRKSKQIAWARNFIMWDVRSQGVENFEKIRAAIKTDPRIKMLLGYSATLENLANFLRNSGDSPKMFRIETVIGFGEALSDIAHTRLKEVFNCKVISLYSNQENGMLAPECVDNMEFHVNSASYYLELLRMDSDDPVSIGEIGRIVVTDLFNHAMPMIRYDTGDTGKWKKESECGWNSQVITSIQGAMVDSLFDTKGNEISSDIISVNMWAFDKLLQFQFIQEGAKQYILRLNGAKGHYEDYTFVDYFKGLLGQDAEIAIEHVQEIPVLASGKRKIVVNNYIKGKILTNHSLVECRTTDQSTSS